MAQKKIIEALLAALTAILAVLIAVGLGYSVYEHNHVFIGDSVYPKNAKELDLRQETISLEHYRVLQENLPECRILWNVPFQGRAYPSDIQNLKITSLSESDLQVLDCFRALKKVDALNCEEYELLFQLEQQHPDWEISYRVPLAGKLLPKDIIEVDLDGTQVTLQELLQKLQSLKQLKTLHLQEPNLTPEELETLQNTFPDLAVAWDKTLFGSSLSSDIQELDISGMTGTTLEEIRDQAAYLPNLQKLIMCDCGFPNEEMADFREEMREKYKVVWSVKVGTMWVRTDETYFMPTKFHQYVRDDQIDNLYYCEDMICVDVGHHPIKHVDWVAGMPHVKYLIVADAPLQDVTPLAQLKEVVWLELFMTDIRDITPLLSMTSVEDLNLARIPADLKPIAQMKWVNNLWISGGWVPGSTVQYLRDNMPDTYIDSSRHHNCCGRGWRQLQNYYDMRDIVGMPYFRD